MFELHHRLKGGLNAAVIRNGTRLLGRPAGATGRGVGRVITRADRPRIRALVGVLIAAAVLAGCSTMKDGVGALMVDPGRYEGYNCKELAGQWSALLAREKQLRNLIDRADESTSGVVIGALAYRSDYQTVLEQKKVLQRTAAEKNCQITTPAPAPAPAFSSDKMIH